MSSEPPPNRSDDAANESGESSSPKKKRSLLGKLVRFLFVVGLLYGCLLGFARFYAGPYMVYLPTTDTEQDIVDAAAASPGWSLVTLDVPLDPSLDSVTADTPTLQLTGLYRAPGEPEHEDTRWAIWFGGNASSVREMQRYLQRCLPEDTDHWGAIAIGYRGYDASEGSPTEPAIVADSQRIVELLQSAYNATPGQMVIIGHSLGSGVAVQLSAILHKSGTPPAATVLISPYRSIAEICNRAVIGIPVGWAMTEQWFSTHHAPLIDESPTFIVHGTNDSTIPYAHGETIASLISTSELHTLDGAGHNDIWNKGCGAAVRAFLTGLDNDDSDDDREN